MVTVELVRDWRRYSAGRRFEKTAGAAEVLVARGIAKYVDDSAPAAKPEPEVAPKPATKKASVPVKKSAPKPTTKRATKKAAPKRTAKKKATR